MDSSSPAFWLLISPVEDVSNILLAVERVVGSEGFDVPLSQVVSQTTDGASTMLSTVRGVSAKAKSFNSHIFIHHCFNHHLVLAGKDGQHHIPNEVDKRCAKSLNIFCC